MASCKCVTSGCICGHFVFEKPSILLAGWVGDQEEEDSTGWFLMDREHCGRLRTQNNNDKELNFFFAVAIAAAKRGRGLQKQATATIHPSIDGKC